MMWFVWVNEPSDSKSQEQLLGYVYLLKGSQSESDARRAMCGSGEMQVASTNLSTQQFTDLQNDN